MHSKAIESLSYWIRTRERIRLARAEGEPRPWTTDSIFNTYHFCNIRRNDDRGTKERRAVVRKYEVFEEDLPWVYTASNLLNYAPSLEIVLAHEFLNGPDWLTELKVLRHRGQKVFHAAYVVSTNGITMDKVDYIYRVISDVRRACQKGAISSMSCKGAFSTLRNVKGLGSFLCGQIVADLKNSPYLNHAPDRRTFSVMGPGSKKGLDLIFGGGTNETNYEGRMCELEGALPEDILAMKIDRQDLQNCLCEFSKYNRYKKDLPGRRRYY